MKKLLLSTFVMLMTTLFSTNFQAADYVLEDFYRYIPLDDGTYRIMLSTSLIEKLENAEEVSFTDTKGNVWSKEMSLPNPAPEGEYNGIKVTSMSFMFSGCDKISTLDLSSFNTTNISAMDYMFSGCSSLTSLNLTSFNTDKVANMSQMFNECSSLTSLDLSSFNTETVVTMNLMFNRCSSLISLDLSNFNTSNVANMSVMFNECSSLKNIDLSSFNIKANTNISYMFSQCGQSIDGQPTIGIVSNKATADLFNNPSKSNIDLSTLKFVYPLNLTDYYTYTLVEDGYKIDLNEEFKIQIDRAELRSFTDSKGNVWSTGMPLPNPAPKGEYEGVKVTNMSGLFSGYSFVTILNLSDFNTINVTNMSDMFKDCASLEAINLAGLKTDNVTDMSGLFSGCTSIITLHLSDFNIESITQQLRSSSETKSGLKTSNVTDMSYMFYNCKSLSTLDISGFNTSNVTDMSHMFDGCSSLPMLDLSTFNTESISDISNMFSECTSITALNLSGFNTDNVNMDNMFANCGKAVNGEPANGIEVDATSADKFNNESITGIDLTKLRSSAIETTLTDNISATTTLNIYTVTNSIIIETEVEMPISIVNVSGVQVKSFVAPLGTTTVNDLPMGVYIVNNQKVLVGK